VITVTDSITFVETTAGPAVGTQPQPGNCALATDTPYKLAGNSAVSYISTDCKRYTMSTPEQYFSYFDSWNAVQTVSSNALAAVPLATTAVPWGPAYRPMNKVVYVQAVNGSDRTIYVVLYGKKHSIASTALFEQIGYKLPWIEPADARLIANLPTGIAHTRTDIHPDYTLIKYANSPNIYRLETDANGTHVRRWIKNEVVFNRLKFDWNRIVVVPSTGYHAFADGPIIE
jgi:hypothetical protein